MFYTNRQAIVTESKMRVRIDTDDIELVIRDGRISSFRLKKESEAGVEDFMAGLAGLTKTIDEMYLRAVNVAHLNHAISTGDGGELRSLLMSLEHGLDLNCNCKNCFLSYIRGFIEFDARSSEFFVQYAPSLNACLLRDKS